MAACPLLSESRASIPGTSRTERMRSTKCLLPACLLFAFLVLSCDKSSNQPTVQMSPQVTASAKRYHLKGKVLSVDKRANMLNVDAEDIPGFMGAMTISYAVFCLKKKKKMTP